MGCTLVKKSYKPTRESGIELLKIFGILLVILSHVVQTLGTNWVNYVGYSDYCLSLSYATRDVKRFVLIFFRHSGIFGNAIFFICSAWFLLEKNKTNTRKLWHIVCDIWVISIAWLATTVLVRGEGLSRSMLFDSIFPTLSQTNWYLTCYIIFCLISPFLNRVIKTLNQKEHFVIALLMFGAYLIINFLDSFPYGSYLTIWISIYFFVAYFKKYGLNYCDNIKANFIMLCLAFCGHLGSILLINYLGLHNSFFVKLMLKWNKNANVFAVLICFSLFNLFRQINFKNRCVNYVASLSMLIYIIHENVLFRTYFRPAIWQWIYLNLGYDLILLWVFLYVLVLFIGSGIIAIIYKLVLEKPIHFIGDKLYILICKFIDFMNIFINKIFKINTSEV